MSGPKLRFGAFLFMAHNWAIFNAPKTHMN